MCYFPWMEIKETGFLAVIQVLAFINFNIKLIYFSTFSKHFCQFMMFSLSSRPMKRISWGHTPVTCQKWFQSVKSYLALIHPTQPHPNLPHHTLLCFTSSHLIPPRSSHLTPPHSGLLHATPSPPHPTQPYAPTHHDPDPTLPYYTPPHPMLPYHTTSFPAHHYPTSTLPYPTHPHHHTLSIPHHTLPHPTSYPLPFPHPHPHPPYPTSSQPHHTTPTLPPPHPYPTPYHTISSNPTPTLPFLPHSYPTSTISYPPHCIPLTSNITDPTHSNTS